MYGKCQARTPLPSSWGLVPLILCSYIYCLRRSKERNYCALNALTAVNKLHVLLSIVKISRIDQFFSLSILTIDSVFDVSKNDSVIGIVSLDMSQTVNHSYIP